MCHQSRRRPMIESPDEILDDLFHGCAVAAFVEQAIAEHGSPCPDKTQRRAYQLYEEALAEKHRSPIG